MVGSSAFGSLASASGGCAAGEPAGFCGFSTARYAFRESGSALSKGLRAAATPFIIIAFMKRSFRDEAAYAIVGRSVNVREPCVTARRHHKRVLVYSHDSFGLGHLRRCRAIANSLVDADPAVSILILSGSPIIGSFDFRSRVDFVRVPGVIKLRNGEYVSLNLHIDIDETLAMRSSIIRHTADIFDPDLLIVDKEPLGLRGEVRDTLELLRDRGTPIVLGLRDVMDDPSALESEWERKHAVPALSEYYDEIWVYGLPQICDPLAGIGLPDGVRQRMVYTGYLRRNIPTAVVAAEPSGLV